MNPKENAAIKALEWVKQGYSLGLGTGSTADYFVRALTQLPFLNTLTLVTSSFSTSVLARSLGLLIQPFEAITHLDLYIDGADEIDPRLNLIKGRGAAMLQEKILATAAKSFLVVADESKLVNSLGTHFPVPVEVIPMAYRQIENTLQNLGATTMLRKGSGKDGPIITDCGNFLIDARFSPTQNFESLSTAINQIPGVVGHGIFIGLSKMAILGHDTGARVLVPKE